MKINLDYYTTWAAWATATTLRLSTPRSPRLPEFLADLSGVYLWWPRFINGLPKGNGLKVLLGAIAYLAQHPDPLNEVRTKMDQVRDKWSV